MLEPVLALVHPCSCACRDGAALGFLARLTAVPDSYTGSWCAALCVMLRFGVVQATVV